MLAIFASASCSRRTQTVPTYLFLWAGDADGKASDFLGVIDAAPASPRYGSIVASIPTGTPGTHPHHTELERDGIVARIVHAQVPPKVEYHLTKWGQSLCPALDELLTWAEKQPSSPSSSQSVKATRPPRA